MLGAAATYPKVLPLSEGATVYPTAASCYHQPLSWSVPVHLWAHEHSYYPRACAVAHRLFRRALRAYLDGNADVSLFYDRAQRFIARASRCASVSLESGTKWIYLGHSEKSGYFYRTVPLAENNMLLDEAVSSYGDRFAEFKLRTAGTSAVGRTQLLSADGISVVSDIDDTIKVSNVANKKALLANTLFYPYSAVEGMAELYREWEAQGAMFHYVSTTPWQLYNPVSSFLRNSSFPEGSYHLKFFWWKDLSWLRLFASPEVTKPRAIRMLLEQNPRRRFILVGDVVEKDPEIYSQLAYQYQRQVVKVYLRAPVVEAASFDRCRRAFSDLPDASWQLFSAAKEINGDLGEFLP